VSDRPSSNLGGYQKATQSRLGGSQVPSPSMTAAQGFFHLKNVRKLPVVSESRHGRREEQLVMQKALVRQVGVPMKAISGEDNFEQEDASFLMRI